MKVPSIENLFCWLTFSEHEDLQKCTKKAMKRRMWMGTSIILASLMACISMAFFLYSAVGLILFAILGGIFWGIIIMNFDRGLFLVDNSWKGRVVTVIRILMIFMISFLVSLPLELELLKERIDKHLNEKNLTDNEELNTRYILLSDEFHLLIKQKEQQIIEDDKKIQEYQANYEAEVTGRVVEGRSGKPGLGPSAKANLEALKRTTKLKEQHREELKELRARRDTELARAEKDFSRLSSKLVVDPLARYEALLELKDSENQYTSSSTRNLSWALRLLFMFLEMLPAIIKLTLKEDDYDQLQVALEDISKDDIIEQEIQALNKIRSGQVSGKSLFP